MTQPADDLVRRLKYRERMMKEIGETEIQKDWRDARVLVAAQAARIRALEEQLKAKDDAAFDLGIEAAKAACDTEMQTFASDEYATGQPLSSAMERFACRVCKDAISQLKRT